MEYYTRRNTVVSYDGYWEAPTDPDGTVRYLNSEEEFEKYKRVTKQEIDFVNNLPAGVVLDVGCGNCRFLRALDLKFVKYGCDPYMTYKYYDNKTVLFEKKLEDCHFPSNMFDIVILYHVIEHLEDPISTIKEIRRVLRPGGFFLIGTPNFGSWVARRFKENFRLLHDKTHISLFTKDSMVYFLEDHGFIIDDIKYPFFRTEYFTFKNLFRLFNTSKVSPPFYGNIMTFYCRKGGE